MTSNNDLLNILRLIVLSGIGAPKSAQEQIDNITDDFLRQALQAQTDQGVSGLRVMLTYQSPDTDIPPSDRVKLLNSILCKFTPPESPIPDILMRNELERKNELLWLMSQDSIELTTAIIDHVGSKRFIDMIDKLECTEETLNRALYDLQTRFGNMDAEAMSENTANVLQHLYDLELQPPAAEVAKRSNGWGCPLFGLTVLKIIFDFLVGQSYEIAEVLDGFNQRQAERQKPINFADIMKLEDPLAQLEEPKALPASRGSNSQLPSGD